MLFDPGTVTLHSSSGGGAEPRGYLHMLDLTRINRMLRPIKAKISAIQLDIRTHPSLGFALESSIPDAKVSDRRVLRSRAQAGNHSTHTRGQLGSPPSCSGTGAGTGSTITVSASSANAATDVLVKRFQSSLTDQFQDVVDKVWWRPFCDDYHLAPNSSTSLIREKGLRPKSSSLGIMCAFAVGRVVAGLSEDDADVVEKYYHIMPAHMRRFAVLEHLVDMCLTQIRVGQLIVPLTLVCARRRADTQTMRLLRHLLECQNPTFQLDLPWAYSVAQMVESGDVWMASLIQHSPRHFFNSQSQKFIAMIEPRHRATMVRLAFEAQLDDDTMISERTKQTRLHNWSVLLIKDSLRRHGAGESTDSDQTSAHNPCDETLEYMAKRLLNIANSRSKDISFGSSQAEALALGPALHSLYVAATRPPCPHHDAAVDEWIRLLDTRAMSSVRLSDFEAISRSYGTLPNLNALAVLLDGLGLYALSMKLLNRMLNNFAYLERNTGNQDGNVYRITRSSLEDHLHEVEGRRRNHASNDGWSYDGMLGDWVQRTPDSKKTVHLRLDDEDFRTTSRGHGSKMFDFGDNPFYGCSSSQEGDTPPNVRIRGKTSNSASRYPLRVEPVSFTRKFSRFSLTPMARPAVPTTDGELSNQMHTESDDDQDEDSESGLDPTSPPTDFAFGRLSISPSPPPHFSPSEDGEDYISSSQDHEESLPEDELSELEHNNGRNRLSRDEIPDITVISDPEGECGSEDYVVTQGFYRSDDTDYSDRDKQEEGEEEELDEKSVHLATSDSDPEYVPSLRLKPPLASVSSPANYREFLTSVEMPATNRHLTISNRPRKFADAISSGDEYVYYPKDEGHGQRLEDDGDINADSAACIESDSTIGFRTPAPLRRQLSSKNTRSKWDSRKLDANVAPDSNISRSSDEYTPRFKNVAAKVLRSRTVGSRRAHDSSEDDATYEPVRRRTKTGARRRTTNDMSFGSNGRHETTDSNVAGRSLRSGSQSSKAGRALLGREEGLVTPSSEEDTGPRLPKRTSIARRRRSASFCSNPTDVVRKKRRATGNNDSSDYDPGSLPSKRKRIQDRRQTQVYGSEESCVVISDDESEDQRARANDDVDRYDGNGSYGEVEDSDRSDDASGSF